MKCSALNRICCVRGEMRNESCDAIDNDERLDPAFHRPANQRRLRGCLQLAVAHSGTIPEDYPATIPCSHSMPPALYATTSMRRQPIFKISRRLCTCTNVAVTDASDVYCLMPSSAQRRQEAAKHKSVRVRPMLFLR